MPGSKAFLYAAGKDKDPKKLKRQMEYCRKCEEAQYDVVKVRELRKHYNDIL